MVLLPLFHTPESSGHRGAILDSGIGIVATVQRFNTVKAATSQVSVFRAQLSRPWLRRGQEPLPRIIPVRGSWLSSLLFDLHGDRGGLLSTSQSRCAKGLDCVIETHTVKLRLVGGDYNYAVYILPALSRLPIDGARVWPPPRINLQQYGGFTNIIVVTFILPKSA